MVVSSSPLRLAAFSSIVILCAWTAPAAAQSAGTGGTSNAGGAGGALTSGGTSGSGTAGQSGGTAAGGVSASGGAAGSAGMSSNLVTNGTFDGTAADPWWSYANNTSDAPADITLAVSNG